MLTDLILAVLLVPALALGWVAVQAAWSESFRSDDASDVLSRRNECGGCGCASHRCDPDTTYHGDRKHEAR